MASPGPPRIFVLSSRPDIVQAVAEAAASLSAQPEVHGLYGRSSGVGPADLVLVDIAEPRATVPYLRRRFGTSLTLVAMIDGAWAGRLGDALSDDWDDYLFYPLSLPELGLVWTRHTEPGEAADLSLDVGDDGQIRAVIPADPAYQRPVVERMVEACRHLAGLDADATFRLRVALGEAVANAILYGSGPGDIVRIDASVEPARLAVRVADEGPGFDPASVPDPTTGDGIERSRGRGLHLLRKLCDEVRFNERGNEVTLTFRAALDPVFRLRAWMADYAAHTGLLFRLQREARGGAEPVFDGLPDGRAEGARRRVVGGGRRLVLEYAGGEGAEAAADLLAGVLAVIDETETTRERIVERRMQRERVLAELEVARDLQLRLLPDPAEFADLAEVAARCEPALSLGGDFYFLARLPERRLGVLLGDVSSHGPSAALIMAITLSTAAAVTQVHAEPAAALDAMHDRLRSALASTEMYMTLFYGVLAPDTGDLVYANAGHPYAYRIGAGIERLPALDPPIGMLEGSTYGERSTRLEPGETLLAFTDGLAERGDPFGDAASPVRRRVRDGERSPATVVAALFADGDEDVRLDDRTAVAVRRP